MDDRESRNLDTRGRAAQGEEDRKAEDLDGAIKQLTEWRLRYMMFSHNGLLKFPAAEGDLPREGESEIGNAGQD